MVWTHTLSHSACSAIVILEINVLGHMLAQFLQPAPREQLSAGCYHTSIGHLVADSPIRG